MESAHILIAEDDPAAAAVLRTVLGRVGYRVTVVVDGAEALRRLEEDGPPDVLLLDWMLPGISGVEVCHRVRQRWDALALPVLMVTARADAESVSAAFDAGASDYITKPFLGTELRKRVMAQLHIKQLAEEQRRIEEHLREREKLSSLGLLVSGVVHDLNNPLAGISGYAQLLLEEETDERKADDLRHILSEVERCRKIVGSLLGFARRNPPERGYVDLPDLLRTTFELRERHLRSSGLETSLQLQEEIPPLLGDAHQLQQVFLNILINAEQALWQGGSTLRVTAGLARNGTDRVEVDFFNDGPPIPAEALPRIFEPFFTTKGKEEGTGLGLAICQRILREHGGDIEVESGEAGTCFRVILPAVSA